MYVFQILGNSSLSSRGLDGIEPTTWALIVHRSDQITTLAHEIHFHAHLACDTGSLDCELIVHGDTAWKPDTMFKFYLLRRVHLDYVDKPKNLLMWHLACKVSYTRICGSKMAVIGSRDMWKRLGDGCDWCASMRGTTSWSMLCHHAASCSRPFRCAPACLTAAHLCSHHLLYMLFLAELVTWWPFVAIWHDGHRCASTTLSQSRVVAANSRQERQCIWWGAECARHTSSAHCDTTKYNVNIYTCHTHEYKTPKKVGGEEPWCSWWLVTSSYGSSKESCALENPARVQIGTAPSSASSKMKGVVWCQYGKIFFFAAPLKDIWVWKSNGVRQRGSTTHQVRAREWIVKHCHSEAVS